MGGIQNNNQVGGKHYKDKRIQPWDYIHSNGIGYLAGNIIKYVSRYKDKSGLEDLYKAKHYIEKLIEEEHEEEHRRIAAKAQHIDTHA